MAHQSQKDVARDGMIAELNQGESQSQSQHIKTPQSLLIRGCDPVMAQRATPMLQSNLGPNVSIDSCTDDDTFFKKLENVRWDVVMFAPGAMRWSASGQPIPGQNSETHDWRVENYSEVIREKQAKVGGGSEGGTGPKIVGTAEEPKIIPILREALGMADVAAGK